MHTLQIWIAAIRPKTLIASISPVVIAFCFAKSQGFSHPLLFIYTLLASLCIQIGTNLANDYFDGIRGADAKRKGPMRITASGLASETSMKIAISFSFVLASIFSAYLIWHGGPILALLASLSIALGLLYTGGPYPIAYLGLGEIFVLLFFGAVATTGTYYLQSGAFSYKAFLLGLSPGCFSCAILTINNLRDAKEDAQAEKKTLVVRFGISFGKKEYALCLLSGVLIPVFFLFPHPFSFVSLAFVLPALKLIQSVFSTRPDYLRLLPQTALLFTFYTLVISQGFILL